MNLLNIISFCLSVVAYSIKELQAHGKLKWMKEDMSFWGLKGYLLKYKLKTSLFPSGGHALIPEKAPDNFYYRFLKIKYKERFPGSASIFVALTDSQHTLQFAFKLFLILTLVTYEPIFNMVWDFIIYFVGFGVVFSLVYKLASK